jgi:hypothetical protein
MLFLGAAKQPGDGRRKRRVVERLDEAGASAQTQHHPEKQRLRARPHVAPGDDRQIGEGAAQRPRPSMSGMKTSVMTRSTDDRATWFNAACALSKADKVSGAAQQHREIVEMLWMVVDDDDGGMRGLGPCPAT